MDELLLISVQKEFKMSPRREGILQLLLKQYLKN